ncbi:UNVERIFIED_CONTAM: hypothetical protein HDU68_011474 [Siphonaria sp. JEL0065]|nr:hypothetical protein HDU68_011474 [Siphonaria sp. JEL0065]
MSDSTFAQLFSPISTQIEQQTPQTFALSNFVPSPMMNHNVEAEIMGFSPQQFAFSTPFIGPFTNMPDFSGDALASPMPFQPAKYTPQIYIPSSPIGTGLNRATPLQVMNSIGAANSSGLTTSMNYQILNSPRSFSLLSNSSGSVNNSDASSHPLSRSNSDPIFVPPRPIQPLNYNGFTTILPPLKSTPSGLRMFSTPPSTDEGTATASPDTVVDIPTPVAFKVKKTPIRRARKESTKKGPSDRREYRKDAEKHRRDMMKEGFEALKSLTNVQDKAASKEQLLAAALNRISELQMAEMEKEATLYVLEQEIQALKGSL